MTRIESIKALELLDSRGNPTVGAVSSSRAVLKPVRLYPQGPQLEPTKLSNCVMAMAVF